MDVNLNVPPVEKLLDYVASGIGAVAGPMLASWKARKEVEAKLIAEKGEASTLLIRAEAQSKAREILVSQDANITGELDITNRVNQRIQFQEQKRQTNIESVVRQAANQLGDKNVADSEPDHDWTARFFNDVQDVSSEEMQFLWAKVLAGEVEQPESTSIRTLGILKNLDQATAHLFRTFCSACIFLGPTCIPWDSEEVVLEDARVPSLGGNAAQNSLMTYGLNFKALNRLNENGLIISDYNSWFDLRVIFDNSARLMRIPFRFQNRYWILVSTNRRDPTKENKLSGVALTQAGRELSEVIELEPMDQFTQDLHKFFEKENLRMEEVDNYVP